MKTIPNPLTKDLTALDNQVKREDTPLPKANIIHVISGMKGSGKSTLALNLLKQKSSPYYKHFDNIFLISPTAGRDPKFDRLVNELSSEGKFYSELNDENIDEIMEKLNNFNDEYKKAQESSSEEEQDMALKPIKKKKSKKKVKLRKEPFNLLILDDCIHALPKATQSSSLSKLWTTSRHHKLSIWVMVQKYNKLPPLLRTQADLLTVFCTNNRQEVETIISDINIDNDRFQRIFNSVCQNPSDFLHIAFFNGRPTFYNKFDKIVEE